MSLTIKKNANGFEVHAGGRALLCSNAAELAALAGISAERAAELLRFAEAFALPAAVRVKI